MSFSIDYTIGELAISHFAFACLQTEIVFACLTWYFQFFIITGLDSAHLLKCLYCILWKIVRLCALSIPVVTENNSVYFYFFPLNNSHNLSCSSKLLCLIFHVLTSFFPLSINLLLIKEKLLVACGIFLSSFLLFPH